MEFAIAPNGCVVPNDAPSIKITIASNRAATLDHTPAEKTAILLHLDARLNMRCGIHCAASAKACRRINQSSTMHTHISLTLIPRIVRVHGYRAVKVGLPVKCTLLNSDRTASENDATVPGDLDCGACVWEYRTGVLHGQLPVWCNLVNHYWLAENVASDPGDCGACVREYRAGARTLLLNQTARG